MAQLETGSRHNHCRDRVRIRVRRLFLFRRPACQHRHQQALQRVYPLAEFQGEAIMDQEMIVPEETTAAEFVEAEPEVETGSPETGSPETAPQVAPADTSKNWFIIHTYSGFE